MKRIQNYLSLHFLSLFLIVPSTFAQTAKEKIVDQLISVTGPNEGMSPDTEQVDAILLQLETRLDSSQQKSLRNLLTKVLDPREALKLYRAELIQQFTEAELNQLLDWSKSPLGKKITASLASTSQMEPPEEELAQFYADFESKPPSAHRKSLIKKYNEVTGAAGSAHQMMIRSTEFFATLSGDMDVKALEHIRSAEVKKMFEENVDVSLHYAFRGLSDLELESYLSFLKTGHGSRFAKVSLKLADTLTTKIFKTIEDFLKKIPAPKAPPAPTQPPKKP